MPIARWLVRISAALLLAASAATARGDLHFVQPDVDAGEVYSGKRLEHVFVFVNDGPAAVEIVDVHASCGCLRPKLPQRVYQPGELGSLRLEVNTLDQAEGPKTWQVHLRYRTAGTEAETGVQMTARIKAEITVRPAAVTVYADSAVGHGLALTDFRPHPLAVADVRTTSPYLQSHVTGTSQDEAGHRVYKIGLQVAAAMPEGRHDETVSIYTDDQEYAELRVPVIVVKRARNRVVARPAEVSLVAPAGQPVPSRIVLLEHAEHEAVIVAGVDTDNPAVTCRWAAGPGPLTTLRIVVDRSCVSGTELRATLRVHLAKPTPQDVVIPISCLLR
jgi:hypothetical protein